jgi:hypothetical protein
LESCADAEHSASQQDAFSTTDSFTKDQAEDGTKKAALLKN